MTQGSSCPGSCSGSSGYGVQLRRQRLDHGQQSKPGNQGKANNQRARGDNARIRRGEAAHMMFGADAQSIVPNLHKCSFMQKLRAYEQRRIQAVGVRGSIACCTDPGVARLVI